MNGEPATIDEFGYVEVNLRASWSRWRFDVARFVIWFHCVTATSRKHKHKLIPKERILFFHSTGGLAQS